MSITQSDKNFWISYFQNRIDAAISRIKAENQASVAEYREAARIKLMKQLDIETLVNEYEVQEKAEIYHQDLMNEANKAKCTLNKRLYSMLTERASFGYISENAWRDCFNVRLNEEIKATLDNEPGWPQEIAELLRQREGIEAQIMLATSPTSLRDFVQAKMAELSLP